MKENLSKYKTYYCRCLVCKIGKNNASLQVLKVYCSATMYGLTQDVLTSMTNYHKGSDKSQRLFQLSKPADDTAYGTDSPFTSLPLGLGLNKVLITTKSKGS